MVLLHRGDPPGTPPQERYFKQFQELVVCLVQVNRRWRGSATPANQESGHNSTLHKVVERVKAPWEIDVIGGAKRQ